MCGVGGRVCVCGVGGRVCVINAIDYNHNNYLYPKIDVMH